MTFKITIYRRDSETPIVYENVKHTWTDGLWYVVSQYSEPPIHHYFRWPIALISHIKEERENS